MGVQLNIKSAEARALAEEVAAETGWSITEAITRALRRQLDDVRSEKRRTAEARQRREHDYYLLIADSGQRWRDAASPIDHGELLYDDQGLPR